MNYIIDRRNFIKLTTLTALSLSTTTFLSSCHVEYQGKIITKEALEKYNLATYITDDNQTFAIYIRYISEGKYYSLNLDNSLINEELIKESYNITSFKPATDYIKTYIGPKKEYTAEDLKQTLDAVEQELNQKEKVLTK